MHYLKNLRILTASAALLVLSDCGGETTPAAEDGGDCLLYTSPSPRDRQKSRMPSSA